MPKPIRRGPASWQVKIRRKLPDGSTSNINRTFETHAEAQRYIDSLNGRIAGHENVGRDREKATSLQEVLQRYLDEVTPTKKGQAQEASRLRMWMSQDWAAWPLTGITSREIVDWRNEQRAEDFAPSTINNAVNLLSAVFKTAITEWGYRVANPVAGVKREKPRKPRKAYLTADDEERLLAGCKRGPAYLEWCVRIALATAMRASEIRRIQRRHIDLRSGNVHLPITKNGDERDVPLVLNGAVETFEAVLKELPVRADGYLFGDPDKPMGEGGLTQGALSAAFADAAERAGLPDLTFHDLRHVATTRLAPLHRDALDLAKTTGHKTLGLLMVYYNEAPGDRAARLRKNAQALAREARSSVEIAGGVPANVVSLRSRETG